MPNNYICALDISSSKVSAAVAKVKQRRITDIFFETQPSKGIRKGAIVDSIDLTGSIGRTLKNLKAKSGINIKFIYANISGLDIVTRHSRAIIPLAERGNKVITLSDIQHVNEQARILGSNLEEEIVHQIAQDYAIDSNSSILNPLGLYSHRLEVDLYLICAKLSFVQALGRAVNQAGYEIKELSFSGLATSEVVFKDWFKKGTTVLCDIGSDITELLLFSDGILKDLQVLSEGGNLLTTEIEDKLKIPFELAEEVKVSYGSLSEQSRAQDDKEILIKHNNAYKPINQKSVSEILTLGSKSICQEIRTALEKMLPCQKVDNFVTTGRTVLLEGFLEMLEGSLGIPVKLGRVNNPKIIPWVNKDNTLSGQRYLTYITALGIICRALYQPKPEIIPNYHPTQNPILNAINRIKEIYQEYF
ncbi:MAG: cell division protein FtsA [Candidatus Omnitrophota bacterium]